MEKKSIDVTKIIGHKYKPYEVDVKNNDLIIYALSIGFSQCPLNTKHFKFTYELNEDFTSFFTIPVVIGHR